MNSLKNLLILIVKIFSKQLKMKTTAKGRELIKKYEGLRLTAYQDIVGVWTIGYGTTKGVKEGMTITETEADQFLIRDLEKFENNLNSLDLNINQDQFDALISWIYNLGFGNFKSSTLLKLIQNNPNDTTVINIDSITGSVKEFLLKEGIKELNIIDFNFKRWCNAGGKPYRGLYNRRVDEAKLYFS